MNTDSLPKTLLQAVTYFANEGRAHDFLVSMRWPDGVQCAHCQSANIGKLVVTIVTGGLDKNGKQKPNRERRVWNCKACKKQFTAKIGTIFADSPLPLSKWLPAFWLVVNAKNGVSSCELARSLGITQKSAWHMGHRIRKSIQRGGGIVHMDGVVEVDESFIGGKARNMHADKRAQKIKGTGGTGKTAVMGLLQRHSEKNPVSRVVTNVIANTRHEILSGEIRKYVLKGSEIQTDAHAGYVGMDEYCHKVVDHAECYVKDGVHTNGLENYWSLLKRTLKGTYVHCAPFHLFRYLDEQNYRFNERKENDQSRFLGAMETVKNRRLTWKNLTGKSERKEI